jgi:UDP-N-acetylmuramoyl-tripeptide--D-alanyl-D-alanine ligase
MISLKHLENCQSVIKPYTKISTEKLRFCVDTRAYQHPMAFVAIPGQRVNPLDLIDDLLSKGCPAVFYTQDSINAKKVSVLQSKYPSTSFVGVSDSVIFLQEITALHIREWQKTKGHHVFAISGSNGKTTHKEMLSFMLKSVLPGKIVATEKNNNNHLGVPLTLMEVSDLTEFVVLELGSNHPGEIKVLCDIAHPDSGITTNIGATHLEFFGSEEAVFDEEAYLYHAVEGATDGKGFYLINSDDPFLKKLSDTKGSVRYGKSGDATVKFHDHGASLTYQGKEFSVENKNITGEHNKLNLITCYFIAVNFFPTMASELKTAATKFVPTKNRSQWLVFEGKEIFLDAYNANPSSMRAALSAFKESLVLKGKSITESCVVLGDMNELGSGTERYHRELGAYVRDLGFTNVHFIGRFSEFYQKGFPEAAAHSSTNEFKSEYRRVCLKNHEIHFIKGSRSLQLESLFDIT